MPSARRVGEALAARTSVGAARGATGARASGSVAARRARASALVASALAAWAFAGSALADGAPPSAPRGAADGPSGPRPPAEPRGEPLGAWRLVDEVLVGVEGVVVTESELQAEGRLALLRARGLDAALAAPLTPELRAALLRTIVERELLVAEARRLKLRAPEPRELDRELDALAARVAPVPLATALAAIGFVDDAAPATAVTGGDAPRAARRAPGALEAIVRSEAFAARFLEDRVGANVIVEPREVERCLAREAGRLVGLAPADARRVVERAVRDAAVDRSRRALVAQLARRAELRVRPGLDLGLGAPVAPDPGVLACPLDEPKGRAARGEP